MSGKTCIRLRHTRGASQFLLIDSCELRFFVDTCLPKPTMRAEWNCGIHCHLPVATAPLWSHIHLRGVLPFRIGRHGLQGRLLHYILWANPSAYSWLGQRIYRTCSGYGRNGRRYRQCGCISRHPGLDRVGRFDLARSSHRGP